VALGRAVYVDHKPGYRTDPIIAIPGGEAGHVLRLIRPHVESCAWGKKSSVKLSLLDAASSSIGYWVGNGGPIYQITFAGEYNESSELLAVRQASEITIFRPMYHRQPIPAVVPSGYAKQYPSSRLSVNPVTVLTADKCGSKRHADVSFNPFYSRQFGTVDDRGRWSIWDLEGTLRNDSTLELVSGKSGHIFDNLDPTSTSKNLCNADGWHRILWVVNVSTIVVCSRRHIAVFNIEAAPTRLQSPEFDPAKTTDWILDIKRSPTNSSHLFLLTTSRIIWLEVIADKVGENFRGLGIHVIISHFHFRDANDETLSLKTVVDGNRMYLVTCVLLC
jgi:RNA polymerase I-specific transcription initiation factor RRN6